MPDTSADSKARHQKFLCNIVESHIAYAFYSPEQQELYGTSLNDAIDNADTPVSVIPLWSDSVSPGHWMQEQQLHGYELIPLHLEELHELLTDLANGGLLVGIDWTPDSDSNAIQPQQLIEDIANAFRDDTKT